MSKEGRSLYMATLFLELACVASRFVIGGILLPIILAPLWAILFLVFSIAFLVTKQWAVMATGLSVGMFIWSIATIVVAFGPVVWSFLHFMGLNGSSRFDRFVMRARGILDEREQPAFISALAAIPNVGAYKMFSGVYVVSSWHTPRFAVIGTDLYLAKCLLFSEKKYLTAVIAHALGWVNGADGRLVMALRRLVVAPMYILSWMLNETAPGNMILYMARSQGYVGIVTMMILNAFLSLSGGGWGQFLLTPWWSKYWNVDAAMRADAFAKSLGQRQPMIEYLDHNQLFTVATPYSLFPEETDMEPRINALMK